MICRDIENRMVWLNPKCGKFIIKSLYFSLSNGSMEVFLSCIVLNMWVPLRIGFFTWEAMCGKILTLDQLKKGG